MSLLAPAPMNQGRVFERRAAQPAPPSTNDVLARIVAARPVGDDASVAMSDQEREDGFAVIIEEIAGDPETPTTHAKDLYGSFGIRCKMKRIPGNPLPEVDFLRRLTVARASFGRPELATDPGWVSAVGAAASFDREIQLPFLLFARAAVRRGPCPSDATLAAGCNLPLKRMQARIANMSRNEYILVHMDMRGMRTVSIPSLGIATAPGDAAGPNVMKIAPPEAARAEPVAQASSQVDPALEEAST